MRQYTTGSLPPPMSDWIDFRKLTIGVPVIHTIPAGANWVRFSTHDDDFYARLGTLQECQAMPKPDHDILDGTAPARKPEYRQILKGQTHIAIIAFTKCDITLAFWK